MARRTGKSPEQNEWERSEVNRLKAQGFATKKIAAKLNISVSMVSYLTDADLRRSRRTPDQMRDFNSSVRDLLSRNSDDLPMSVRHTYYLAVSAHLISKDTGKSRAQYTRIVSALGDMREDGTVPWEWIVDGTRGSRFPRSFASANSAVSALLNQFQLDPWTDQPVLVEVWCESDSIAGTLEPVTLHDDCRVRLCPTRGQSSKVFVHTAAQRYLRKDKPVVVVYVGDYDPSGLQIPLSVEERMGRYSDEGIDLDFRTLAINPAQIMSMPELRESAHQANSDDNNYNKFIAKGKRDFGADSPLVGQAVEVEAIHAGTMRQMLKDSIEPMIDRGKWAETIRREKAEYAKLEQIIHPGRGLGWPVN